MNFIMYIVPINHVISSNSTIPFPSSIYKLSTMKHKAKIRIPLYRVSEPFFWMLFDTQKII